MTWSDRVGDRVWPGHGRVWQNAGARATTGFDRLVRLVLVEKLVQPERSYTHTVTTMCVLVLSSLATFPPCPVCQPGQTRATTGFETIFKPGHDPAKTLSKPGQARFQPQLPSAESNSGWDFPAINIGITP